jgi:hypothetical protein
MITLDKSSSESKSHQITLHILFVLSEMIDNNLNLSICRGVKVNCQIRKFKITKLKQQVMPTYCHIDSTDVIENDYSFETCQK